MPPLATITTSPKPRATIDHYRSNAKKTRKRWSTARFRGTRVQDNIKLAKLSQIWNNVGQHCHISHVSWFNVHTSHSMLDPTLQNLKRKASSASVLLQESRLKTVHQTSFSKPMHNNLSLSDHVRVISKETKLQNLAPTSTSLILKAPSGRIHVHATVLCRS